MGEGEIMAKYNWKDEAQPIPAGASPDAKPAKYDWMSETAPYVPQNSRTASALRGAAQGLSMGFADEITGAGGAAYDYLKGGPGGVGDNYVKHREESRAAYKAAEEQNPLSYMAGNLGGGLATAFVPGLGGASIAKMAALGAAQGLGSSEGSTLMGNLEDAAIGGAVGGGLGAIGKGLSKIPIDDIINRSPDMLKKAAEHYAIKATGATGKEALKYKEGLGRELLDRGIVKAGETPADVARRAQQVLDDSGSKIGSLLEELDAKGAGASIDDIIMRLETEADTLSQTPGNEKVVSRLRREVKGLYSRLEKEVDPYSASGESFMPASMAEEAKRNFQAQTNYNSPKSMKASTNIVANAFKGAVDDAAERADPELFNALSQARADYKTFKPVQKFAESRASTLNQSPFGGLGDTAAAASGAALGSVVGGPVGGAIGVVAPALRRYASPRMAGTAAVNLDRLSNVIRNNPVNLGRFQKPLAEAAARGGNSLAATHYILQQTDPEYGRIMREQYNEQNGE